MATSLYRKLGEQFFDANGKPLSGGFLYYYVATTTTPQATYSDSAGNTPNSNPIQLDSSGRLTTPVYIGSSYPYKETVTDFNGVVLPPWPFDNIPAAAQAATTATFALSYYPPRIVTSASSPLTLTASDMGTMLLANTVSGSINMYLPDAAAVTAGSGVVIKKVSGNNTLTIIASGSQTIDGAATMVITLLNVPVYLVSDGANWRVLISGIYQMLTIATQNITAGSTSLTIDLSLGWIINLTLNASVTTFAFSNVPPTGTEGRVVLHITNGGSNAITWPAGVKWVGGVAPTLTASGKDTIMFTTNDNATTVYGYVIAKALA
jgi:hypothetical protein